MIGVVNYGLGNLQSVLRAFERLGVSARIIATPEEILGCKKLILPGVGHAGAGMAKLRELSLIEPLNKRVLEEKIPILGLCLGMQLMTKRSEEGNTECLGWFNAETVGFDPKDNVVPLERRVPHMGWNSVVPQRAHGLLRGIDANAEFYFAHSYYVRPSDTEDVLAITTYQGEFVSMIGKDNIFGAQFHPEKSQGDGLRLLKNFAEL